MERVGAHEKIVSAGFDNCNVNMADAGVATALEELLGTAIKVAGCGLHILNWAYKQAVEAGIGSAGLSKNNAIQCSYQIAYLSRLDLFDSLAESYSKQPGAIQRASSRLVPTPVDSRWGTIHDANSELVDEIGYWRDVCKHIVHAQKNTASTIYKVAKEVCEHDTY